MKVYVLEMDNGKEYEDYSHWVEAIFKSYRSASDYVLKKEFHPFAVKDIFDEWHLQFEMEEKDADNNRTAWIYEIEVRD